MGYYPTTVSPRKERRVCASARLFSGCSISFFLRTGKAANAEQAKGVGGDDLAERAFREVECSRLAAPSLLTRTAIDKKKAQKNDRTTAVRTQRLSTAFLFFCRSLCY